MMPTLPSCIYNAGYVGYCVLCLFWSAPCHISHHFCLLFSISLKGWFYVLSFTFNCLRFSSWGVVALVLGLKLNPIYPQIPLGTVTVNLVGGFIIGFAMAYFAHSDLSPNYKLFVITGFVVL